MTRLERALLGAYGGAWLALLAICALCLWLGHALPLLPSAQGVGHWLYLGLWALLGLALAALPRADQAWRAVLAASAYGLLLNGLIGAWQHLPSSAAMSASLLLIALLLMGLRPLVDVARIRKHRPAKLRTSKQRPSRRLDLPLAWIAWSVALGASFLVGHKGAVELRGIAHTMLLLVLFAGLPAVIAGAWRRRAASLWLLFSVLLCVLLRPPTLTLILVPLALLVAALAFALSARRTVQCRARAQGLAP